MFYRMFVGFMLMLGIGSVSYAGGWEHYNSHLNHNRSTATYSTHENVVEKIIIEKEIPLYDTTVVTTHNNFIKILPQPIVQLLKIERTINPQKYLVERAEYNLEPIQIERVVLPDNIIIKQIQRIKNECRSSY